MTSSFSSLELKCVRLVRLQFGRVILAVFLCFHRAQWVAFDGATDCWIMTRERWVDLMKGSLEWTRMEKRLIWIILGIMMIQRWSLFNLLHLYEFCHSWIKSIHIQLMCLTDDLMKAFRYAYRSASTMSSNRIAHFLQSQMLLLAGTPCLWWPLPINLQLYF